MLSFMKLTKLKIQGFQLNFLKGLNIEQLWLIINFWHLVHTFANFCPATGSNLSLLTTVLTSSSYTSGSSTMYCNNDFINLKLK